MHLLAVILVAFVGIEHLGIMALEMFAQPQRQAKAFDLDEDFVRQAQVRVLLANQGIYNGMLGLAILASFWLFKGPAQGLVQLMLLVFVAVVALFGGFTATKKIWLLQMLPAILALLALAFSF